MYQLDASIDVQAVVVSLIEVIVESEKKFREGKDLADFVEIVSSVLSSIIRDYKQRRKKIGISLGAAILIVIGKIRQITIIIIILILVGRLLRHLPQLTQSNPLFINDIATFCFSVRSYHSLLICSYFRIFSDIKGTNDKSSTSI